LDVPQMIEHGERSAIFENSGTVISRRCLRSYVVLLGASFIQLGTPSVIVLSEDSPRANR